MKRKRYLLLSLAVLASLSILALMRIFFIRGLDTAMRIADVPRVELDHRSENRPQPPKITQFERDQLLDSEFSEMRDTGLIPHEVIGTFPLFIGAKDFEMANPGQEFQVGDVIYKPGLPLRRLVLAGKSADRFFLHYERGGVGHSWHLVVFDLKRNGQLVWAGSGFNGYRNIKALRQALKNDKFADDREYSY